MPKHKQQHRITQAVTHIPLCHTNSCKRAVLDELAEVYQGLCQDYTIYFCEVEAPDPYAKPHLPSVLSQRWQRVAIQQAAGIAQSWRSNRDRAYAAYERQQAWFESKYPTQAEQEANTSKAPQWREFNLPHLKQMKIEANQNVAQLTENDALPVKLEAAKGQGFDYWIRISTLDKGQPLWLPVKLAHYHKKKLAQHEPNTSVTLERRTNGTWWLTLTFDEQVKPKTPQAEPVAIDVGINSFITTSTGQHYGTFQGKLTERFERDRAKRQRKAKLRAVLKKKGVENLPSTASATGERLRRHTMQAINKAVKDFFHDHPDSVVVLEDLSISTMRFKSRRMNAKLYASNLAHIPEHIEWVALKQGLTCCQGQSGLQFARMQPMSLRPSPQPPQPTDVLLSGVWVSSECGRSGSFEFSQALARRRTGGLYRLSIGQSIVAQAASNLVCCQRVPVVYPPAQLHSKSSNINGRRSTQVVWAYLSMQFGTIVLMGRHCI